MPSKSSFRKPFDEQLAAIQKRTGNQIPTARWDDLRKNAHDRAFAVAGAMKADLLADFARSVESFIQEGESIEKFRQDFDEIVAKHGWDFTGERNWRTRVIYRTNMQTTYSAGRLSQLRDPELQEVAPLWMYVHGGSADPRPDHLSWDGLVLPANDPWWDTHYPPNGWGCTCSVVAVSEETARRQGGRFEDPPRDVRGSIDDGWDYMPGANVEEELRSNLVDKTIQLPAELASANWVESKDLTEVNADRFKEWAEQLQGRQRGRGESMLAGVLSSGIIKKLNDRDIRPASAALVVRDTDVLHTFRDSKTAKLSESWYKDLPKHLNKPQAILLERKGSKSTLHYVYSVPGERSQSQKLVIPVDYKFKARDSQGSRVSLTGNIIRSGRIVQTNNLQGGDFELLEGKL